MCFPPRFISDAFFLTRAAHALKGEGIYAYVTLKTGKEASPAMRKVLVDAVRAAIGPIATPDIIHFTPELPKTRSGKIMRRM